MRKRALRVTVGFTKSKLIRYLLQGCTPIEAPHVGLYHAYLRDSDNRLKTEYTEDDLQGLREVMDYAMQDYKTERRLGNEIR